MSFAMPKARVGQPVYWYPDGDKNHASHGIVVGTGEAHLDIDVSLCNGEFLSRSLKVCVRHCDDPENTDLRSMYGTWEHTEETEHIQTLTREVQRLAMKVGHLERKLDGIKSSGGRGRRAEVEEPELVAAESE